MGPRSSEETHTIITAAADLHGGETLRPGTWLQRGVSWSAPFSYSSIGLWGAPPPPPRLLRIPSPAGLQEVPPSLPLTDYASFNGPASGGGPSHITVPQVTAL